MAENENDIEKDIPEVLDDSLNKTEIILEKNKKLIGNNEIKFASNIIFTKNFNCLL